MPNRITAELPKVLTPEQYHAHIKAKGKKRDHIGHAVGEMNQTELDYAGYLDLLKIARLIVWWRFEGITLKLAGDLRLTIDFFVLNSDSILECHDTKAAITKTLKSGRQVRRALVTDDGRDKLKMAAGLYPFDFFKCFKDAQGNWVKELVKA